MRNANFTIRLTLLCLAFGIVGYLLGNSMITAQSISQPSLSHACTTQILGIPTPQQMMRVAQGTPFTVPPGKLFVVTGIITVVKLTGSDDCFIDFDSQQVLEESLASGPEIYDSVTLAPGLVAPSGTVVSARVASSGEIAVLGYLANE